MKAFVTLQLKYFNFNQVFVALLRAYQPECKELVRLALDSLVPALPTRLRHEDFIKALKWAKKIMIEEGHVVAQLAHIWSMVRGIHHLPVNGRRVSQLY